jgi:peptide deformylase
MILKIVQYPNPGLKGKSKEVKEITSEIKKLALDMKETMTAKDGLGLAAPQIGISQRMIAVRLLPSRNSNEDVEVKVFINPKILKRSKETEFGEEGCLSLPGLYLNIKRHRTVEVSAIDENGNEIKIQTQGLAARILQHEIDHLEGILFFDRLGLWEKMKFKRKLRKPQP